MAEGVLVHSSAREGSQTLNGCCEQAGQAKVQGGKCYLGARRGKERSSEDSPGAVQKQQGGVAGVAFVPFGLV